MANPTTTTPKQFINRLVGKPVVCKLKWGHEFRGHLISVDGYLNIRVAQIQEFVDGTWTLLGDGFIRSSTILYLKEVEDEDTQ